MINQMVLSTEIEWIGYEERKNMLQVEFLTGSIYQYDGVSKKVYQDFMSAESYGTFHETQVKGKYPYRKVR